MMSDGVITIQATTAPELSVLAGFWYDVWVLRQQTNPRIQLLPNAQSQWEQAAHVWLYDETYVCLSAHLDGAVVGAIFACCEANTIGLAPVQIGRVLDLILDIHLPQVQRGIGTKLLGTLQMTLQQQGIEQIIVTVPAQTAVEQAFWRGVGAKRTDDLFWMDFTK